MSLTLSAPSAPPCLVSASSTSRNVSMPASLPWSMTTSEPMSCWAITRTASMTEPSGPVVNSVLPLMRRISLTSMNVSRVTPRRKGTPGTIAGATGWTPTRLLVEDGREPHPDAGEHVEDHERDHLDAHERHHAHEDRVERHVRRRDALEVERGHRHRRRQERRLQVERHEQPEEQR